MYELSNSCDSKLIHFHAVSNNLYHYFRETVRVPVHPYKFPKTMPILHPWAGKDLSLEIDERDQTVLYLYRIKIDKPLSPKRYQMVLNKIESKIFM